MDKNKAIEEAKNVGRAYFYDTVVIGEKVSESDMTDEEIFAQIREDVQRTQLPGMPYWEMRRDALREVLAKCSSEELEEILDEYGHTPEEVGGSREFLSRLYELIDRAINERKSGSPA